MGTTTRKCRVARALVVGLLCAIGFLYPLLAPTPHRIDRNHLPLVRRGMTEAEVEAIFGVPAGGYDSATEDKRMRVIAQISTPAEVDEKIPIDQLAFSGQTMFISARHGPNPYVKTWFSRHGVFHVAFDREGRVAATGSWGKTEVVPPWQTWWQRLIGK
jgi:hypothetical protein